MSQRDVAKAMDMAENAISDIELGLRAPLPEDRSRKVARLFNLNPDELGSFLAESEAERKRRRMRKDRPAAGQYVQRDELLASVASWLDRELASDLADKLRSGAWAS